MIGAGNKPVNRGTREAVRIKARDEANRKAQIKTEKEAATAVKESISHFRKQPENVLTSAGLKWNQGITTNFGGDSGEVKHVLNYGEQEAVKELARTVCGTPTPEKVERFVQLLRSLPEKYKAHFIASIIENDGSMHSNKDALAKLSRDERLGVNQLIRQANGLIAYNLIASADVTDHETFFDFMDRLPEFAKEIIEENAAFALLGNAKKLGITGNEEVA